MHETGALTMKLAQGNLRVSILGRVQYLLPVPQWVLAETHLNMYTYFYMYLGKNLNLT
jgi:hypothetical protein